MEQNEDVLESCTNVFCNNMVEIYLMVILNFCTNFLSMLVLHVQMALHIHQVCICIQLSMHTENIWKEILPVLNIYRCFLLVIITKKIQCINNLYSIHIILDTISITIFCWQLYYIQVLATSSMAEFLFNTWVIGAPTMPK